ncbi:MAG: sugar phosphate isomerase/epimerase [Thermomicrobiales bacterium]|nr:sugar phosphate isomerase/epimerase [Thermomicrobiales bacterium]
MKLACNSILFGGLTPRDAIAQVAGAGFESIELCGVQSMGAHIADNLSSEALSELESAVAEYGIGVAAIEIGGQLRSDHKRLLYIASRLQADVVNMSTGGESGNERSFSETVQRVAGIAQDAGTVGLRVAVKPHVGHAVFDSATSMRLVQEANMPNLGLNFDPSHLYRAGEDPSQVAGRWGAAVFSSHFRDCESRSSRGTPELQVPGGGEMPLDQVWEALVQLPNVAAVSLQIVGARDYSVADSARLAENGFAFFNTRMRPNGSTATESR